MPKITRKPELEDEEHPYVIQYKCKCGKKILYRGNIKPDNLQVCFHCLEKENIFQ